MVNRNPQLDSLLTHADRIAEHSIEDLIGKSRLGDLSLDLAEPLFRQVQAMVAEIRQVPIELVPETTLQNIIRAVKEASERFAAVKSFSPADQGNPREHRDLLLKRLRESHEALFNALALSIAYLRTSPGLLLLIESKAADASRSIAEHAKTVEGRLADTQREAESILESLRRAAGAVGVSQHAIHFLHQATEHKRAATAWLAATLASAVLGLGGAVMLLYFALTGHADYTTASGVQLAIAKLLAFSLLYFIAIVCAKNYGAHRHNYVVNKHRQNALSTFEAFAKATTDEGTRNAVLLRSTEAIFSPLATGYGHSDAEGPPTPQILEIIRSGVGKSP
jgi:hypothetical protein